MRKPAGPRPTPTADAGISADDWPEDVFSVLRAQDVRQVAYVPDAGHSRLIRRCAMESTMTSVPLTTEEEGVAVLAGAWLGGQRGVLLMQSSGVGNCVNMFSTSRECRFPLLVLVTMRGQWGEANPWQVPMGRNSAPILELCGFSVFEVDAADRVRGTVEAAARMAFTAGGMSAVLLSQRLIGAKAFAPADGGN
jgi:sulfopyruvate decarboxylase alpha subunit